jgi:hypothetical protein
MDPENEGGGTTLLHMKADADIKLFLRRGRRVGAKAFVAWTTLDVF